MPRVGARTAFQLNELWEDRTHAPRVSAYGSVCLTEDEFLGDRYTRLKRIRKLMDEGRLGGDLRWLSAPSAA